MDINVNVRIELSEDSKSFVAGLIKGLASANQVSATSATEEPAKKATTQTVKKVKAAPAAEAKTEEPAAQAAAPAAETKTEEPVAQSAAPAAETKTEEPVAQSAAPAQAAQAEVTLDMLRLVVGEKAADHRDEIKAKLTEMGVEKVTLLPQEKWPEFYDYVKGL